MIGKERLIFDPAASLESDNIGAYLRSSDGTLITHTTDGSKERIDVSTGAEHDTGTAYTVGDKGSLSLAVDPNGDYAPLKVNADGELLVDVQVNTGADKAEDSVHASGDVGSYVLSVREDSLTVSTSASGDYQSFKTDANGALWTNVYKQAPATHNGWLVTSRSVASTAVTVATTALTDRKTILIQNIGTLPAYIGSSSGVTVSTGIRLSGGAAIELELAAGVDIYAISTLAGTELRVAQFAYVP